VEAVQTGRKLPLPVPYSLTSLYLILTSLYLIALFANLNPELFHEPAFLSADRICSTKGASEANCSAFFNCSDALLNWPDAM
jgi:hypothetical protein